MSEETIESAGPLLPQGVQLTPLDEQFRIDPYPVLKDLQVRAPVHEDTQLRRFIYTRHDDVKQILRDRDFWSDPRKANEGTFTYRGSTTTYQFLRKQPSNLIQALE